MIKTPPTLTNHVMADITAERPLLLSWLQAALSNYAAHQGREVL